MGIFSREKPKVRNMIDVEREKYIDEQVNAKVNSRLLPKDLIQPPEVPKEVISKSEDNSLVMPVKITIVIKANSKDLLVQMVDGVSDIVENFGVDAVEEFKIERIKD